MITNLVATLTITLTTNMWLNLDINSVREFDSHGFLKAEEQVFVTTHSYIEVFYNGDGYLISHDKTNVTTNHVVLVPEPFCRFKLAPTCLLYANGCGLTNVFDPMRYFTPPCTNLQILEQM
jgi:hypothetical protein